MTIPDRGALSFRSGSKYEKHMLAGLPSIADIARRVWHGSFVPFASLRAAANSLSIQRPCAKQGSRIALR